MYSGRVGWLKEEENFHGGGPDVAVRYGIRSEYTRGRSSQSIPAEYSNVGSRETFIKLQELTLTSGK